MKNSIKLGALALALTVSFAACSGTKKTDAADSTKIADSIKAADSVKAAAADTTKADTTKKDTTKKM